MTQADSKTREEDHHQEVSRPTPSTALALRATVLSKRWLVPTFCTSSSSWQVEDRHRGGPGRWDGESCGDRLSLSVSIQVPTVKQVAPSGDKLPAHRSVQVLPEPWAQGGLSPLPGQAELGLQSFPVLYPDSEISISTLKFL
jgi:hypothetical protein